MPFTFCQLFVCCFFYIRLPLLSIIYSESLNSNITRISVLYCLAKSFTIVNVDISNCQCIIHSY